MSEALPENSFPVPGPAPAARLESSAGPGQGGVGPAAAHFVDFGYWRTSSGRRQLLTWHTEGSLYLGDQIVAVIPEEIEVRRRLEGWAEHAGTPDGAGWLAQRLEGCR